MSSSIGQFLSGPFAAAFLLGPAAFVLAVRHCDRLLPLPRSPFARGLQSLGLGALLSVLLIGHEIEQGRWRDRDDRRIAQNPHWTLVSTYALELLSPDHSGRLPPHLPRRVPEGVRAPQALSPGQPRVHGGRPTAPQRHRVRPGVGGHALPEPLRQPLQDDAQPRGGGAPRPRLRELLLSRGHDRELARLHQPEPLAVHDLARVHPGLPRAAGPHAGLASSSSAATGRRSSTTATSTTRTSGPSCPTAASTCSGISRTSPRAPPRRSSWGGEDHLAVDGIFRFLDQEPDRALLRDGLDLGHPPSLRARAAPRAAAHQLLRGPRGAVRRLEHEPLPEPREGGRPCSWAGSSRACASAASTSPPWWWSRGTTGRPSATRIPPGATARASTTSS